MTPSEFRRDLWHMNTGIDVLSYGIVCVILLFDRTATRVGQTDGQTDGRTDGLRVNFSVFL